MMLAHPGMNCTEETIRQHFWWPKMREMINDYVEKCDICQRFKKQKKNYGHLPPKDAEAIPWQILCVDLVGSYTIQQKKGETFYSEKINHGNGLINSLSWEPEKEGLLIPGKYLRTNQ